MYGKQCSPHAQHMMYALAPPVGPAAHVLGRVSKWKAMHMQYS